MRQHFYLSLQDESYDSLLSRVCKLLDKLGSDGRVAKILAVTPMPLTQGKEGVVMFGMSVIYESIEEIKQQ
jgi:hypothetical protein